MLEEGQLPDWLVELREQQLSEQPQQPEQPREQPPVEGGAWEQPPVAEGLWEDTIQADAQTDLPEAELEQIQEVLEGAEAPRDMLDDLREQMILADEELELERKPPFYQVILDFQPVQRLVLSVLLLAIVAIYGCMLLVMTGRVVMPF